MTMHPSSLPVDELLSQCLIRRTRHTGPGGQHRNKVETAIEIVHRPTGIAAFAGEQRSQEANRKVAVFRLRVLLAVRIREVPGPAVEPSPMWIRRCRNQRIACHDRHEEFPAMMAEALDAIAAKEQDVRRAAAALGCSATQLIRFVARVPEALLHVNQERDRRGLHPLKA